MILAWRRLAFLASREGKIPYLKGPSKDWLLSVDLYRCQLRDSSGNLLLVEENGS